MTEVSLAPVNALRFGGDKMWLAAMNAAFSLGCVAAMVLTRMKIWKEDESAHYWMILQSLFFGLLAFSGSVSLLAPVAYLGMGVASTMASIQLLNRLMRRSPRGFQGRMSALRYMFIALMIALAIPPLTSAMSRNLNAGILCCTGVLFGFACLAVVASLRGPFLGDAMVLQSEEL
jgi:hypothetical protein